MPSKEDLKRLASEIIDSKAEDLIAIAQTILKNPEPGFRELKTAKLVAEQFGALGQKHQVHFQDHLMFEMKS